MALAEIVAHRTGHDALGLPWLMMPRADPRRHAADRLRASRSEGDRHEPRTLLSGLCAAAPAGAPGRTWRSTPARLFRRVPTRLAIISNASGQGNMAIVMVLTSLVLSHHGHSLTAITISHMFHSAGMFAFTIPLGWASDRYRPRAGDVSRRRHRADRRAVRCVRRGFRVGHDRHLPGRARLVRGQCRLDRADRRSGRDPAPRPRHRRQRKRRRER